MPLPLLLGVGAGLAAVCGVGTGVHGAVKMKDAKDTMDSAKYIQEKAVARFERENKKTSELMDSLGKQELEILNDFKVFSDLIEKVRNRPKFTELQKDGVNLPKYEAEELKKVAVGAGLLLGGLGGAAAGTAGGFAAAGAATTAVMALGTASTGTAIASLSGAALTNATLAALGGGAIAAGGGGIALGTTILGAATLGVGLLVGGVIFNASGSKLSEKADEAYAQASKTRADVNKICAYFQDLTNHATKFQRALTAVDTCYRDHIQKLDYIINFSEKRDWEQFSEKEVLLVQNSILLTSLLFNMCKVQLVLKSEGDNSLNKVNTSAINEAVDNAEQALNNNIVD